MKAALWWQLLLWGLFPSPAGAQEKRQSMALWLEGIWQQPLRPGWSFQLDVQYRRRSGWLPASGAEVWLWQHPVQACMRPWIHYEKITNYRFSVSPLGYWRNFPVDDGLTRRPGSHEFRTSFQAIAYRKGIWSWHGRARYELRYRPETTAAGLNISIGGVDFPVGSQLTRLRLQGKVQRRVGTRGTEAGLSYEFFLGMGKGTPASGRWDQNRICLSVSQKTPKGLRWEAGYLAHWVTRRQDPQLNHCLSLVLVYEGKKPAFSGDAGAGD